MDKPKTALIKLNGTIIKTDGSESKSNFFKFLDLHPDDYSDIAYTPEEAQSIRAHLSHLSTGACAAIPLVCGGNAVCPFAYQCPFVKIDKTRKAADPSAKPCTPIGKQCLVEINLLAEWTRLYIREYEVDENHFTEFMMIRELAEIELMMWRLNNNIAKPEHAELVGETVVGVDSQGNPLTRLEVNAFLQAKERLQNRKSKVIKLMVGDRQEKYKRDAALKQRGEDDPSSNAAKLRGQIDRLMLKVKEVDIDLKQAEGKVIDVTTVELDSANTSTVLSPEDLINKG